MLDILWSYNTSVIRVIRTIDHALTSDRDCANTPLALLETIAELLAPPTTCDARLALYTSMAGQLVAETMQGFLDVAEGAAAQGQQG